MAATRGERKVWDSIMREKRKLTKIGESLKASIGEVDEESWGDQTVRISHYDHILCVFEVINNRMIYRFWLVDWLDTINEPCSHYRGEVSIPDSIMGKTHTPFHDEFVRIRSELGLRMVHDEGFVVVYSNEPTQTGGRLKMAGKYRPAQCVLLFNPDMSVSQALRSGWFLEFPYPEENPQPKGDGE